MKLIQNIIDAGYFSEDIESEEVVKALTVELKEILRLPQSDKNEKHEAVSDELKM